MGNVNRIGLATKWREGFKILLITVQDRLTVDCLIPVIR